MATSVEERVDRWKKKLLDLTKRNRLISFRATKVTTIRIIDEQPPEVFATLVAQGKTMNFLPLPAKSERMRKKEKIEIRTKEFKKYKRDDLSAKHTDIYLQTNASKEQLPISLFRIHSSSNAVMGEQGYNVLFLAIGFLEWYESPKSDVKTKSPLVLVPVEISRPSVKGEYRIRYNEDAVLINPALKRRLSLDFKIEIDELDDDIDKINLFDVFSKIQKKIHAKKRWRVTNDIFLGLFSFAKFMMYKDLDIHHKNILKNRIIQTICGQETRNRESLDSLCSWNELKNFVKPQNNMQVLDADSSQQRAIAIVKKGNNLVIEGPPGTGKSQTIANIIAEFLAENKKVLFVSQKMAALEVVRKRLMASGLGDFCLELHSKKTNKRTVIESLAESLSRLQSADHKRDQEMARLERVKEKLRTYAEEMRTPFGKLDMTPLKAIEILASIPEMPDLECIFKNAEGWDEKKFSFGFELLQKLSDHIATMKEPSLHPWYGSKLTNLSYQNKVKIKKLMAAYHEAYSKLQSTSQYLAKAISFKKPDKYRKVSELLEGVNAFLTLPPSAVELLKKKSWDKLKPKVSSIVTEIKAFNEFKDWAKNKYDLSLLDANIDELHKEYKRHADKFIPATPTLIRERRILNKYKARAYKPALKEVVVDMERFREAKKWSDSIHSQEKLGKELFGKLWSGRNSNGNKLANFLHCAAQFHGYIEKDYFSGKAFAKTADKEFDIGEIKGLRESASKEKEQSIRIAQELFRAIKFNIVRGMGAELEDVPLEKLDEKIRLMGDSIEAIDPWFVYQKTLEECDSFGFKDFVLACEKHSITYENMPDMFRCQFLRSWLDEAFTKRQALKNFMGVDHEKLIEEFRQLDSEQIELAKVRLRHRLSGKISASLKPEAGILQREARKRRAQKPLRKLFKEIPDILCELKPCLMMSPLTVAQFLDTDLIKFDLVIFDEASQIPPEDAIGAIIRGNKIVVAGDTKQLPPTSFFQSAVLTPEDDGELCEAILMELDSILDECATSGFPSCMLAWHYRSRHEHLIAFSNKHLYGSNLYTFPNNENEAKTLGIKFHYSPETRYQRGKVGANLDEAKNVAAAVFEHFRRYPDKSLGVATFNIRQKFAIQDAVEAMRKRDHSLEEYFDEDREESFFVKNLEAIQGDERDVIFISVAYGKTDSGTLPMTFGPINQLGGERRLNVLVTRARHRVEVFSPIKGGDFDLTKTGSAGVNLLKKYLDFAEKGEQALEAADKSKGDEKGFFLADAIYNVLVKKGYKVKKQVGCSGYKIDLAVVDKNNPGVFLLGIECDGEKYLSSKTDRDRDRLRRQVLTELGWRLCRIWSADWVKNEKQTLVGLIDEINKAQEDRLQNKETVKRLHRIDDVYTAGNKRKSKFTTAYKITSTKEKRNPDAFHRSARKEDIVNRFNLVVETEGPICKDEAMRRVSQFWGFDAIGNKVRKRLEEAARHCKKSGIFDIKGGFYWPKGMSTPPIRNRDGVEGISKKIDAVSLEEIREAGLLVSSKEAGLSLDAMINATARLLGYKKVTDDIRHYIAKGIRTYKKPTPKVKKRKKPILKKKKRR
jgi:very-short-patch-repair endonuclease/flagellar biosynthesis GTPase FlhF